MNYRIQYLCEHGTHKNSIVMLVLLPFLVDSGCGLPSEVMVFNVFICWLSPWLRLIFGL